MNKLFLLSSELSNNHLDALSNLVGKVIDDINILLIENAADLYPDERRGFVEYTRKNFEKHGLKYEFLDLREYFGKLDDLKEKIQETDIVWLGGGNVFYLREVLYESGFDTMGKFLEENNILYVGGSAGTVVLCNDLKGYAEIDIPHKESPIYEGLGWFPNQIIPHWGKEKYGEKLEAIRKYYDEPGKEVICIKDKQAVIFDNGEYKII